jgi:hypothetical protein
MIIFVWPPWSESLVPSLFTTWLMTSISSLACMNNHAASPAFRLLVGIDPFQVRNLNPLQDRLVYLAHSHQGVNNLTSRLSCVSKYCSRVQLYVKWTHDVSKLGIPSGNRWCLTVCYLRCFVVWMFSCPWSIKVSLVHSFKCFAVWMFHAPKRPIPSNVL